MNIILFLGSGISIDSGLPNVVALTKALLDSKSNPIEITFLRALRDYDKKARKIGGTTYTNSNKIVGEAYRDYTSYEDLYYLCDEIAAFDWGLHNNSMVSAFTEALLEKFPLLLKEKSKRKKLLEIGKFAHASKKYINKAVLEKLSTPKEIIGLDLVVQLANSPQITSLDILTLNHDLLVEGLLLKHKIDFADGFGNPDGEVRWFEPDKFLSSVKVKLIKLHGSIDWYSFLNDGYEKVAKVSGDIYQEKKSLSGKPLQLLNKSPKVLSGLNKINYYNSGIYTDIHYHFQRVLYQNSLMIMSGYGWGDEPINNRLMTWLDKKKENKLILLHKYPEELMKRSMVMDRDFYNWEKSHKLKSIDKWLSEVTLEEVLKSCS